MVEKSIFEDLTKLDIAQIFLFIYLMTIRFYTSDLLEAEQTSEQLIIQHSILFVGIFIVLLWSYITVGIHDFRFRIVFYIVPMMMAAINVGLYGALASIEATPKTLVIAIIPTVIYAVLAFRAVFTYSESYADSFGRLFNEFNQGHINRRIDEDDIVNDTIFGPIAQFINQTLDLVQANLIRIIELNDLISSISEELSASSEETSAKLHEITTSANEMANGANQQSVLVDEVYDVITHTDQNIGPITTNIKEYADAVSQIALQTNILALNAGIEASRAGDYGRGFAVVAENVRRLSDETKNMSEQISTISEEIIKFLHNSTDQSKSLISDVSAITDQTKSSSNVVSSAISEVNSAMVEVSSLSLTLSESAMQLTEFLNDFELNT